MIINSPSDTVRTQSPLVEIQNRLAHLISITENLGQLQFMNSLSLQIRVVKKEMTTVSLGKGHFNIEGGM